ncbi:hypothetical protein GEMRC1_012393 [Eukaryota sp. GEM-RC1]
MQLVSWGMALKLVYRFWREVSLLLLHLHWTSHRCCRAYLRVSPSFLDSPPTPPPHPLYLATELVKQINCSLFIDVYTVKGVEDELNSHLSSILKSDPRDFHDIDVSSKYLNTSFDRKLTLFTITLSLHEESSSTEVVVNFVHDDAATVSSALQVLYYAFSGDKVITLVVPADTPANREVAISEYCFDALSEYPTIIANDIRTRYDSFDYYNIYLRSGTILQHVTYVITTHIIVS